ncbi:MAG TPA: prepilin-type N-terminal cleavage/methylation domain-containing protein [bacterium]|jgi:prepilin-type N-terminal cleavage/methylation domain-containing protein|nr:prepilin-type N-terminal cleavage/methylation domain-containing protein [bacterium]HOG37968.1 prepilin-type N-terminal cleavage/methylation domain-containing protein [bacterium]HQI03027.1 prepilin-type N-terminal cleavage/methylation domain-containing protein [bacterium]
MEKIYKKPGFTLLEMIVATAIFSIVSTICIGVYILTMKANTKIIAMQRVQNEMRFAMDYISREVRLGNVDYSYYPDFTVKNPITELALEDNSGNKIFFRKQVKLVGGKNNTFLQVKYNDSGWSDVTGNSVSVKDMYFYISPTISTEKLAGDLNKQTLVTIVMTFVDNRDGAEILLQTTVSARNYIK